jgi:predicted Zn-dependent protease
VWGMPPKTRNACSAEPWYGRFMDKIATLTEILTQNPNDAFARYGLAMEHANQGDTATALEEFEQLTTAHPDYTAGYQMSAQLLIKNGRHDEARQRLEAGVAAAQRTGNRLALNEMSAMLDELSG